MVRATAEVRRGGADAQHAKMVAGWIWGGVLVCRGYRCGIQLYLLAHVCHLLAGDHLNGGVPLSLPPSGRGYAPSHLHAWQRGLGADLDDYSCYCVHWYLVCE